MARLQAWTTRALSALRFVLLGFSVGALLLAQNLTPSQLFEKVRTSVVVVKTLDTKGNAISQGSGVKLPSGRIVTNFHVVKGGASFLVGQNDKFVPAFIKVADAQKDLCLLEAPGLKAPAVVMGRASGLKVGAVVYAVGAPEGLELSLSNGLVSQLRGANPPIIQTTAAISPGSSGGGLFDAQGRLVGITSFYVEGGQSLNFALPVEWVEDLRASTMPAKPIRSEGEWLAQAVKLEAEGKLADQRDWCQAWVNFNGTSSVAWYNLGVAYGHIECNSEAIDAYLQALKIDPDFAKAWNNLLNTLNNLKRYSEAIEACRVALKINPNFSDAWNTLGIAYDHLNQYSEAIEAFRQVLRINPEDVDAWNNLGITYTDLKRYSEAIEAFRQALKINPDSVLALSNLGVAYDDQEQYSEAIEVYRKALKINPENALTWSNLGNTYGHLQRYSDAIEAHRQAVRINPENALAWYNLGNTCGHLQRYSDAIEAHRQAVRINPDFAAARYALGLDFLLSGNKDAAMEVEKQLRRINPAQADRLFDLIVPR